MNTLIKKIKGNIVLTIITALLLGGIVLLISFKLANWTTHLLENYFELYSFTRHVILKSYMIIFSLITIWFLNKKSFKNYGLAKPIKVNFFKMTFITIGITIVSILVASSLFPIDTTGSMPSPNDSLLIDILNIWIWSSIGEEFLARGLVQGFMNHLKNKKVIGLSIPVIFSGLFFGAMHIITGMAAIVFFTTIGGFVMAYYREKTESIIPAIYVHFLANATGVTLSYIMGALGIM